MKKWMVVFVALCFSMHVQAAVHKTPACYATMPVSCTFDEMTLEMCNEEGKKIKAVFLLSQIIHIPGGNKFGASGSKHTCLVQPVKDSEPKKYKVSISK